jgi:N utilization substance protein A
MQEIREAERNKVYDEYADRVGDIISGTISRRDRGDLVVQLGNQLGKMEAYLPGLEQTRGEQYRFHDRMKFFVVDVRKAGKGPRGPQIIVSRSHPSLLRRLFELEVPEIESGHVLIKSVARDPGQRSKIAVAAKDDRYDPVGSCVGHRGQRVQAVVDELRNEKVDIVRWSPDQRQFIIESLSPAKVVEVRLDEINKAALVIVQDAHLSLAIGKEGQNVRLAAKLTGWRIDIRSESQLHAGDIPEFVESVAPLEEPELEEEDIYDTKKIADLPDDDDEEDEDEDDIYEEEVIDLTPVIEVEPEVPAEVVEEEPVEEVIELEDVEDEDDSIIDLSGFDDDEDED